MSSDVGQDGVIKADGGTRPAATRERTSVLIAYAAFVLVGVSAGVGGVLLPAQIGDYGVDKVAIGTTFFTFSAGFMLAGATAGALIHRFGVRIALALGAGGYILAALYLAARPPFLAFVLVQVLAGYGTGIVESVLNAHLAALPKAATLLNRLHAFFGVGALLGPLLAAWLLGFLPWTAVWLVLAVACLPLLLGFLVAFPARPSSGVDPRDVSGADGADRAGGAGGAGGADRAGGADGAGATAQAPRPFAATMRSPAVLLAAVFLAVYVGLEMSVGNWGYSFLVTGRGQADLLAGYTVSGYWLGLTLGRFLISPAAERIGLTDVGMVFACLTGVAGSALLIWAVPTVAAASAGLVLLGFFLGPIFPTTMAVVPRLTAARLVPTAIGVLNGVSVTGGAAFPWLAGTIAQHGGVWTLLPFAVALALLQLAIWGRLAGRLQPT